MTKSLQARTTASGSDVIVIGLLIVFGCLIMINSFSVVDTARDVYNAWQIAEGERFPLEGPYVALVFHGGPVWYYILALPLFLSSSWVIMSLWVGLLTSMKYVLAYACGKRLIDPSFGLIWACLLALPDFASVNYLIFSHTNLVETSLLLFFYTLIRWQEGTAFWFLAMCLVIGLGIHAHPTVYVAGLLAVPFLLRALRRQELAWWMVPAGALMAALPLAPYLVSQSLNGWPDLQTSRGYFESQPLWANLLGFWDVLRGALLDGPLVALRHLLGLRGLPLLIAGLVLGLILAGGLALSLIALIRKETDRIVVLLFMATVICIAAVAVIRYMTPFYQTFVIYPPFYGVIAWGWWWLGKHNRFPAARILAPIALIALAGFGLATFQMGREGHLTVPQITLMDIRKHETDEFTDTIYYPGWGRQKLGEYICETGHPIFFHGFASLVLEQSYALEARMRCDTEHVYIGGQGAGNHLVGVSHRSARYLGISPEFSVGSMGLYKTNRVITPFEAMPIPTGDIYPPRPVYISGVAEREVAFGMEAGEIASITNLYHYWMPYKIEVRLNGDTVEPMFRSMVNAYYGCMDCLPAAAQNWSVTIEAPRPELVEVVTFIPARQTQ